MHLVNCAVAPRVVHRSPHRTFADCGSLSTATRSEIDARVSWRGSYAHRRHAARLAPLPMSIFCTKFGESCRCRRAGLHSRRSKYEPRGWRLRGVVSGRTGAAAARARWRHRPGGCYARRSRRLTHEHSSASAVAVLEASSPGNMDSLVGVTASPYESTPQTTRNTVHFRARHQNARATQPREIS